MILEHARRRTRVLPRLRLSRVRRATRAFPLPSVYSATAASVTDANCRPALIRPGLANSSGVRDRDSGASLVLCPTSATQAASQ